MNEAKDVNEGRGQTNNGNNATTKMRESAPGVTKSGAGSRV